MTARVKGVEHLPPASAEALITRTNLGEVLVQKAEPTKADDSEDAAKGGTELSTRYIDYVTPANDRSESEFPNMSVVSGVTFLEPPEHPESMYKMYQLSAYVEPVIDALQTNVYKAPYTLHSVIPFDRPIEAAIMVKNAMMWERVSQTARINFDNIPEISDEEVEKRIEILKKRAVLEKHYLDRFFEEAVPDMSYRELGALTGQDYEITGNAYWEVSRDTAGNISRFQWVPSLSMRCTPQRHEQIGSTKYVRNSVLSWVKTPQIRRFRQYGQMRTLRNETDIIAWFKEFGDPRVMSRKSGKYYDTMEEFQAAESGARANPDNPEAQALPATEILHFKVLYGGSSAYGKPRWSGIYVSLLGARDLDEENQKIVKDEAVPNMMVLVAGGTVGSKSFNALESKLKEKKEGRKGLMLIEANAQGKGPVTSGQQPTIQIEKLKGEQNTDMLYQKYDERSEDKADSSWRIPAIALGKAGKANRTIADVMQRYTEDQVYEPLRSDKDGPINNLILADLNITMWRYETASKQPHDPKQRAEILQMLVETGILTPNEARELASDIFSQRLEDLQGLWTLFPPRVLTVLLQTKNIQLAAAMLGEDKEALIDLSNKIRDTLGLNPDGSSAMNVADAQKIRQGGESDDPESGETGEPDIE